MNLFRTNKPKYTSPEEAQDAARKANAKAANKAANKREAETNLQNEIAAQDQLYNGHFDKDNQTQNVYVTESDQFNNTITKDVPYIDKDGLINPTADNNNDTSQNENNSSSENISPKQGEDVDLSTDNSSPAEKKKRAYSIWQAYKNGDIDKEGATYYTVDAISNYLKNLGRDFNNVRAQYTGGAIDNNYDQSQWQQRNNALNAEEAQTAKENMGGQASRQAEAEKLANISRRLSNASASITNRVKQYAMNQANNSKNEVMKQKWMALAANPGNLGLLETLGFGAISSMMNAIGLN